MISIDGADVVEFANDCAAISAGRRRAERSLNEYCIAFDLFRFLIIVKFIVKRWERTVCRGLLKARDI